VDVIELSSGLALNPGLALLIAGAIGLVAGLSLSGSI
jgi:hypothetical protein